MGCSLLPFLLPLLIQISVVAAFTNAGDYAALLALKDVWENEPPNWVGSDPCSDSWEGITCTDSRVTSISLASVNLEGELTADIASLSELQILDLSNNKGLYGPLPQKIGNLKQLTNLQLISCSFSGPIPDTIGSLPMLVTLSLNSNSFTGRIPPSIGNLSTLFWLDLADNQLEGPLPVSDGTNPGLDKLLHTKHFHLGQNKFSGPIPDQLFSSNMVLIHLLLDGNQLTGNVPESLGHVQSLEVVRLDRNSLNGTVPSNLNNLASVRELYLSNNEFTGPLPNLTSLDALLTLDLSNNSFDVSTFPSWIPQSQALVTVRMEGLKLEGPVPVMLFALPNLQTVTLKRNKLNGTLDVGNSFSNQLELIDLEDNSITDYNGPTGGNFDVILVNNPICGETGISESYCKFPTSDAPYSTPPVNCIPIPCSDIRLPAPHANVHSPSQGFYSSKGSSKSPGIGIIIGAAVGGSLLLLLVIPFAKWNSTKSSVGVPQLKGARNFSFEELKKYTKNFSDSNDIGSGGYGKVYRGILQTGELIAIKRAQQGSLQGGLEFKTEIELLSRVHHRNVVSLLGFCFDRGEQMLIYEFVPNGSLKDTLSGKTGIVLDWGRRLKIALGAARGLAYLHELANPPIIHRDIKSTNILLDERLNAKVADFGLSKLLGDVEKGHVTTQVKGTMGYLDPEYYMTQQLTEKSDVYSFGVLLLELLTARNPIERGKYIVREVKMAMDKTKNLYNLTEILDPAIVSGSTLKGLDKFVDLAMTCVEESGAARPPMSEVVKEIENIMQLAGMNPNAESASSSATYEDANKENPDHPYGKESFQYSGTFPPSKIEPH
ncbi:probable leucine-rich repeat receptor-like protein kinase At5g49770 [Carica papaya]|uniref:probable leucine-rich repeat receptor-like protein kinase At5g49770 n=1 Tax=Carica papaya TaxID=3649 RepID=UPI000B8D0842|nr:probable leucine-rich repeat receptor-like protein kinase At5g49770 [Carica papaya]